ncbi:hypothetical protein Tco_0785771, partial [Tanacetum coccineum]
RYHSLDLGGFAWYYTHVYIEDGVMFNAIRSLTFLAKGFLVLKTVAVSKYLFVPSTCQDIQRIDICSFNTLQQKLYGMHRDGDNPRSSQQCRMNVDPEFRLFTGVSYKCYDKSGDVVQEYSWWNHLHPQFTFSENKMFTVIGCDDYALVRGLEGDSYSSGYFGLCGSLSDVAAGECSGKGCCQISITKGHKYFEATLNTFSRHINVSDFNNCGLAFLSEEGSFLFGRAKDII